MIHQHIKVHLDKQQLPQVHGRNILVINENSLNKQHYCKLFCADDLSVPSVTIDNITPFSMRANWNDINYPVDSWNVVIKRIARDDSDESEETRSFVVEVIQYFI